MLELLEHPEPQVEEPDEDSWLFASERDYQAQLADYQARQAGPAPSVGAARADDDADPAERHRFTAEYAASPHRALAVPVVVTIHRHHPHSRRHPGARWAGGGDAVGPSPGRSGRRRTRDRIAGDAIHRRHPARRGHQAGGRDSPAARPPQPSPGTAAEAGAHAACHRPSHQASTARAVMRS